MEGGGGTAAGLGAGVQGEPAGSLTRRASNQQERISYWTAPWSDSISTVSMNSRIFFSFELPLFKQIKGGKCGLFVVWGGGGVYLRITFTSL